MLYINPKFDGSPGSCFLPIPGNKTNCIFPQDIKKENPISNTGNKVFMIHPYALLFD